MSEEKKYTPKNYNIGVYCKSRENCEYFSSADRQLTQFEAIVKVKKISKGKEFDLVLGTFGAFNMKLRRFIVRHNHARRQLLTCKIGQFALMYGETRLYKVPHKTTVGKTMQTRLFFPYMIQGMYVPKAVDIEHYEEEVEQGIENEIFEELSEEKEQFYNDTLKADRIMPPKREFGNDELDELRDLREEDYEEE